MLVSPLQLDMQEESTLFWSSEWMSVCVCVCVFVYVCVEIPGYWIWDDCEKPMGRAGNTVYLKPGFQINSPKHMSGIKTEQM
jgi:hypothetical protein